jgi:uncharacterized protein YggE
MVATKETDMTAASLAARRERTVWLRTALALIGLIAAFPAASDAQAVQGLRSAGTAMIVLGEATVQAPPDQARISSGVTTRAKTVKEAIDGNSKTMAGVMTALSEAGIAAKDIQTSRFSIQPVYAAPEPRAEQKLVGYAVTNQVRVRVRELDKLNSVLDKVTSAGATDIGNIEFLVSNQSKLLDQAREGAIADARRKAEIYAKASGLELGRVVWVSEDPFVEPPAPGRTLFAGTTHAAVPISAGEDTLRVSITVGFELSR